MALPSLSNQRFNLANTKVLEIFSGALSEEQQSEFTDVCVDVVGEAKHLGLSLSVDPCKSVEFASKCIGVGTERVQRAFSLLLHPSMKAQYVILFTTAAVQHWLDFYGRHLPPEHAEDLYRPHPQLIQRFAHVAQAVRQ